MLATLRLRGRHRNGTQFPSRLQPYRVEKSSSDLWEYHFDIYSDDYSSSEALRAMAKVCAALEEALIETILIAEAKYAVLDIGFFFPSESPSLTFEIPHELTAICSRVGLTLELSIYKIGEA
jgi:hypothetical protein